MGETKERHLGFLVLKKIFKITLDLKIQHTDLSLYASGKNENLLCVITLQWFDDKRWNAKVWLRVTVNSDLKILMSSSKHDHSELLLLK